MILFLLNISLNIKDEIKNINKTFRPHHKQLTTVIREQKIKGSQISIKLSELLINTTIAVPIFALAGSIFYQFILLNSFSINSATYFSLSDYIPAS